MEWITLPPASTPAEWLAWEEALLEDVDTTPTPEPTPELLWFWESQNPFVVVGYGQKAEIEADVTVCESEGIPILRRCSGGGTVVQGPGCLNYGILLGIASEGPTSTITGTNQWVMERQREAFAGLLAEPVVVRGHTDLAIRRGDRELKFSGNAQRRKRRALLFHGTLLRDADLGALSRWLRMPSWAPEYRQGRPHQDFVTNTGLGRPAIEAAVAGAWGARASGRRPDPTTFARLMARRYADPAWHAGRRDVAGPEQHRVSAAAHARATTPSA